MNRDRSCCIARIDNSQRNIKFISLFHFYFFYYLSFLYILVRTSRFRSIACSSLIFNLSRTSFTLFLIHFWTKELALRKHQFDRFFIILCYWFNTIVFVNTPFTLSDTIPRVSDIESNSVSLPLLLIHINRICWLIRQFCRTIAFATRAN